MNKVPDNEKASNYLAMAEQADAERQGPQSAIWLDRLEADYDRLLATLHSFVERGQAEAAQRLAGALSWFWAARGRSAEGRDWLNKAIALPSVATGARSRALYEAGLLAFRHGDNQESKSLNQESLAIARRLGDKPSIVAALVGLARAALRDLDFASVRAFSEEGLAVAKQLGDKHAVVLPLHLLAELNRLEGNYDHAAELYDQSLALNRELGNQSMIAIEHHNKGYVALHLHDFLQARALFQESLRLEQTLGRQPNMAFCLAGLAGVATAQGSGERAARLFGAAQAQFDKLGVILDPTDRPEFDRNIGLARTSLDEATFASEYASGQAMTLEQAIDYAFQQD